MLEIKRTTLADYEVLTQAYQLHRIDEEFKLHLLAWQTVQAGASDKSGKPVYRKFSKFYDYENKINEILDDIPKVSEEEMSFFNRLKHINESR